MNPLTLVKRIQNINAKEAALGISDDASWHAKYKDSAYVYVGGIPFDLTEGDLLAVFAQYGEIVDVNLVRDKSTGKSKGFAFLAYEDQRSTNLAVDNLNGAQVLGRIIRVDHVTKYKKKEEEDEEAEQKKREERGVCRAFQKGECNRGAGCKFSHDERRAANTGWGHEEDRRSRWNNDKFEDSRKKGAQPEPSGRFQKSLPERGNLKKDYTSSRAKGDSGDPAERAGKDSRAGGDRSYQKQLELEEKDMKHRDESEKLRSRWSRRQDNESNMKEYRDRRDEKRTRKQEPESYSRDDKRKEKSSGLSRDYSP